MSDRDEHDRREADFQQNDRIVKLERQMEWIYGKLEAICKELGVDF